MRPGRIVDVHSHYLPVALARALERRDEMPCISSGNGTRFIHYGPGSGAPLAQSLVDIPLRLSEMGAHGIDVAVISPPVPGVDWFDAADGAAVARECNDELADLVRAHPDRLAALAVIPMQAPEAAAAELERVARLGLRGATVFANVAGRQLDEPDLRVVFDTAGDLGMVLLLHPTYPVAAAPMDAYALVPTVGFLAETTTAALRLVLGGLYERRPDFKLLLPHVGSLIPFLAGRIDYEAERMPGGTGVLTVPPSEQLRLLYTDSICDWAPALRLATEFLGSDRVTFGTDYPIWDPARSLDALARAGFDEPDERAIRSGTADRLFLDKGDA